MMAGFNFLWKYFQIQKSMAVEFKLNGNLHEFNFDSTSEHLDGNFWTLICEFISGFDKFWRILVKIQNHKYKTAMKRDNPLNNLCNRALTFLTSKLMLCGFAIQSYIFFRLPTNQHSDWPWQQKNSKASTIFLLPLNSYQLIIDLTCSNLSIMHIVQRCFWPGTIHRCIKTRRIKPLLSFGVTLKV